MVRQTHFQNTQLVQWTNQIQFDRVEAERRSNSEAVENARRDIMRKVQMYATLWTLVLALPFTVIALVGTAYITNHLGDIATAVSSMVNWRGVAVEGSARWPEIAGMIIGQLLILSILLIARRNGRTEELTAR
jgi:hypothetical protein